MIFYAQETWIGLIIASLPAIASAYLFFFTDKKNTALGLLLFSAFLLRLLMISLDPFVHEWDERYHALVAKNMITHPFMPMLVAHPVMAYDMLDWSNNHIWLHKQPLFLWQMAASMKIFGVHMIAMRLPSAIMGTIIVWLTYDICKNWMQNKKEVAFIAAFLTTFSAYTLELISGHVSLEHNDIAFLFYVTCSFWAWTRYVREDYKLNWALWIGAFVGLAVLNKWLTGYLVFGGWGLYLLLTFGLKLQLKHILHLLAALLLSVAIFLPWQLYISAAFPVESAIEFKHNSDHFTKDFGHPGDMLNHLRFLPNAYQHILLVFALIGIIFLFRQTKDIKKMGVSFLAMIFVVFAFFSIMVATKMPAFVFPVSPLVFAFMALGIYTSMEWTSTRWKLPEKDKILIPFLLVLGLGVGSFKPWEISHYRSSANESRNLKINNSTIFKNLPDTLASKYIILNCKSFENVELMFYKDARAYHWFPPENIIDSLQQLGHRFAAFRNTPNQGLPAYIYDDPEIVILEDAMQ